jgi:hypothetical protein
MCVWSTPNTDDIPAAFPPFEKAAGFRFDGGAGAMDVEVKERLEALERLLRPADLVQKVRLRLLHDLVPKAVRVAVHTTDAIDPNTEPLAAVSDAKNGAGRDGRREADTVPDAPA